MLIEDDVADLRSRFSGAWLWLHLSALVAFLFPYVSFAGQRYFEARFLLEEGVPTVALWEAIARFIWNGGQEWQAGWNLHWSFSVFIGLLAYNAARGLLLWKTITLERYQEISGLPADFSLDRENGWRRLVNAMSILVWLATAMLLINSWHFLTQRVPI